MACCKVNRCCFCLEHTLGVKLLALFLILMEVIYILLAVQLAPGFVLYISVACAFGFFSNIMLLIAVFRVQRWFCIPWLIYIMLVVVALCLISVLQVVISLGASNQKPDWLEIVIVSAGCLALAGLYLYFWIVVLELFIKLGPLYYMSTVPPPPQGMYPAHMLAAAGQHGAPPVPVHAVVYDSRPGNSDGPQSMFTTTSHPQAQLMYGGGNQQPTSLPVYAGHQFYQQSNVRQF